MWEDNRGKAGSVWRGVAHRDDAKDRHDEATRSDHGAGHAAGQAAITTVRRLPTWAVPVAAALSVLVVVGATFAVTQGDSDDGPGSASDPGSSTGVGDGDGDGEEEVGDGGGTGSAPDSPTAVGTVTGEVSVTFTKEGASEVREGALTFDLDCSAGTTCTLGGFVAGGGLAGAADDFFTDYLALDWAGGPATWTHTGATATSCADNDTEDVSALVTGTLTLDGDQVTVQTSRPEYELGSATEADPFCSGPATTFNVVGTLS